MRRCNESSLSSRYIWIYQGRKWLRVLSNLRALNKELCLGNMRILKLEGPTFYQASTYRFCDPSTLIFMLHNLVDGVCGSDRASWTAQAVRLTLGMNRDADFVTQDETPLTAVSVYNAWREDRLINPQKCRNGSSLTLPWKCGNCIPQRCIWVHSSYNIDANMLKTPADCGLQILPGICSESTLGYQFN